MILKYLYIYNYISNVRKLKTLQKIQELLWVNYEQKVSLLNENDLISRLELQKDLIYLVHEGIIDTFRITVWFELLNYKLFV